MAIRDEINRLRETMRSTDDREKLKTLEATLEREEAYLRKKTIVFPVTENRADQFAQLMQREGLVRLEDYAKQRWNVTDIRRLGFSDAAFGKMAVFAYLDSANKEIAELTSIPGEAGKVNYYGFSLLDELRPEHEFRALSVVQKNAAVNAWKLLRTESSLISLTVYTYRGISSCDQFVQEFADIARQSGFEINFKEAFGSSYAQMRGERPSFFGVSPLDKRVMRKVPIREIFSTVAEFSHDPFGEVRHNRPLTEMGVWFVGFPTFDASGRPKFGE